MMSPRVERALRALGSAALYTVAAEVLFDLEPQQSGFAGLFLFGLIAAPAVAVVMALRALDLRTCIANGGAALVALPMYAELVCDCAPSEPNDNIPPGSAVIGLLIFSSLPGFVGLVLVVWWIAARLKHGVLWQERQW